MCSGRRLEGIKIIYAKIKHRGQIIFPAFFYPLKGVLVLPPDKYIDVCTVAGVIDRVANLQFLDMGSAEDNGSRWKRAFYCNWYGKPE